MQYISKSSILHSDVDYIIRSCENDRLVVLHLICLKLYFKMFIFPTNKKCGIIPVQESGSFELYKCNVQWYQQMLAYILEKVKNTKVSIHKIYLFRIYTWSSEVRNIVATEHDSTNEVIKNRYKWNQFQSTIASIIADLTRSGPGPTIGTQGRNQ